MSLPSSSWVALPCSKPRSWFFGPSGEFQVLVVLLEEVLAAATAGQHREEGVVVPTGVLLLGLVQRQEEVGFGGLVGAVEGHHHLVQAPQEEVDLGPQQRLAALLGRRPQDQIGQQFGIGLVALGQPTHCNPLRGLPGRFVQPLRLLEDLRALEDVLVRDELIEQRFPPVLAGVEDLAGQFLDHGLDRGDVRPAR